MQRLCNQKDQEMLIETMKQAEKEQHYSNLIAEYEEAIKQMKVSEGMEEEAELLRIKNKELEEELIRERSESLQEISKMTKEKEDILKTFREQNEFKLSNLAEQKDNEINTLKEENKELQDMVKENNIEIESLKNTIEGQHKGLESVNKMNDELTKQLMDKDEEYRSKIIELQEMLTKTKEELSLLKVTSEGSLNNTENDLKTAYSKLSEYEQEVDELKRKLSLSSEEVERVKKSYTIKIETLIKQSEDEADVRRREYKLELQKNEQVIKDLEEQVERLETKATIQTKVEEYKEFLKAKEIECESYLNKITETEENANTLNTQLEFLDKENTKLRNEITNLKNDLQTIIEDHSVQLNNLKKQQTENLDVMI